MKTRYPGVTVSPDRHGKLRARFRRAGHSVYLSALPDTPGFDAEYRAILAGQDQSAARPVIARSIDDLLARFYRSADFAGRGTDATRKRRRGLLEPFRDDFGRDLVADFGFEHIEAILLDRSRKRTLPGGREFGGEVAAHQLRKELVRLFRHAVKLGWIAGSPLDHAGRIGRSRLEGHHSWSEQEIAQYQARHPIGTKPRLALEIILWTGQRRGDALLFGPRHVVRGKINFRASKNGADLWLPIATDLRRAIDAMPSVGLTSYLVTGAGKSYTKDGFGNWFARQCDMAGLPQCRAHGLRKAIARRLAESHVAHGAIKAVGGWKGDAEVTLYTAAAAQEGLADVAVRTIEGRFSTSEER